MTGEEREDILKRFRAAWEASVDGDYYGEQYVEEAVDALSLVLGGQPPEPKWFEPSPAWKYDPAVGEFGSYVFAQANLPPGVIGHTIILDLKDPQLLEPGE